MSKQAKKDTKKLSKKLSKIASKFSKKIRKKIKKVGPKISKKFDDGLSRVHKTFDMTMSLQPHIEKAAGRVMQRTSKEVKI